MQMYCWPEPSAKYKDRLLGATADNMIRFDSRNKWDEKKDTEWEIVERNRGVARFHGIFFMCGGI